MKKINCREEVIKRNKGYLKKHLGMTEKEYFGFMKKFGPPRKKFCSNWSELNPTSGWCGGMTNSLRLGGTVPQGYVACRHKVDPHYYLINSVTGKVIDLTIYQFKREYPFDYQVYKKSFMNVLSHDVRRLMKALGLKIDRNNFSTRKGKNGQTFISKKNEENKLNLMLSTRRKRAKECE